ncbi:hypothetical protein BDR07DRAFT_1381062 [Suillus spraguei]|nr:hypothetical protein BDR07DRAFT_1381062 [Suillus spraguei]
MTVKMQIDIARYSKIDIPKNTGHNEEKEEKLLEEVTIIAWYLPDALTKTTQGLENVGSTPGCINLSPAWFQQGHENLSDLEVSASLKGPSSENILKAIARPGTIALAALRVMHPQQYFAGLRALSHLGDKALSKELPQMPETLQYWASMFNSLSIISNLENPQSSRPFIDS